MVRRLNQLFKEAGLVEGQATSRQGPKEEADKRKEGAQARIYGTAISPEE